MRLDRKNPTYLTSHSYFFYYNSRCCNGLYFHIPVVRHFLLLNKKHAHFGKWNEQVFQKQAPLVLELGCGKGEYTVALAKKYPEKNFVGIDIKGARMWRGAKTSLDEGISNTRFLRSKIEFLPSFFSENEVDEIWITFPDPQLKNKRERKRLTSPRFLQYYRTILVPGGTVNLKTDSYELFEYTVELLKNSGELIQFQSSDLYSEAVDKLPENELISIQTHYEKMFVAKGKKICYLRFTLNQTSSNG